MTPSSQSTPRLLQIIFIVLTLLGYIIGSAFTVWFTIRSLMQMDEWNVANVQYYVLYNAGILVITFAALIFAIIFFLLRRDKKITIQSIFDTIIFATCVSIFITIINGLAALGIQLIGGTYNVFDRPWTDLLLTPCLPLLLAAAGTFLMIRHLRYRQQW